MPVSDHQSLMPPVLQAVIEHHWHCEDAIITDTGKFVRDVAPALRREVDLLDRCAARGMVC